MGIEHEKMSDDGKTIELLPMKREEEKKTEREVLFFCESEFVYSNFMIFACRGD